MSKSEQRLVVAHQDEVIIPFGDWGILAQGFEASIVLVNSAAGLERNQYRWRIHRGDFVFRKLIAPTALRDPWMASLADVSKPGVIEVAPMPGATFFKGLELPGAVLTSTGACVVAAGRQHGMAVQHSCAGHWLPSDLYELIGTHTAGPALIRRGAQLSQEPNFSLTRRRQELLEMALSYAMSNCADLAQAMAYEGPENEQLVICGSRISAAPTEEEFGDLLDVVTDVDDIKTLPE